MLTSFSGNLYCALETGHVIVVGGRSIDSASKVNLSLSTGKVSLANVALHISVRFHDDVIVRNSKLDGQWGNEEREDNLHESAQPNPLIAGKINYLTLSYLSPFLFCPQVLITMTDCNNYTHNKL